MPYVCLGLLILVNAIKGVFGKKITFATNTVNDVAFYYGLRMVLCAIIGAILVLIFDGVTGFAIDSRALIVAALTGILFALNCMLWVFSQRKGAYVICDVLIVASSIIPILLAYIFYNETISLGDIIGYLGVIVGCVLIVTYNNQINKKVTFSLIVIYIFYFLAVGLSDFGRKVFQVDASNGVTRVSANGFTFYSFIFCALTFIIFYLFTIKKSTVNYRKALSGREFLYTIIVAILSYAYTYLLVPASAIDSTILFPIKNGVGLIINVVVAAILFKEKPTLRLFVGIAITIMAIVVIGLF